MRSIDQRKARGEDAERVLSNPAVQFALSSMKEEIVAELVANPLRWYGHSSRKRDRLVLSLQAITEFESRLRGYIRRGEG